MQLCNSGLESTLNLTHKDSDKKVSLIKCKWFWLDNMDITILGSIFKMWHFKADVFLLVCTVLVCILFMVEYICTYIHTTKVHLIIALHIVTWYLISAWTCSYVDVSHFNAKSYISINIMEIYVSTYQLS